MTTYTFISLDVEGATLTQAFAINDEGQIVGDDIFNNHFYGFIYDGTTFSNFKAPTDLNGTSANGINNFGDIVGQLADGVKDRGFLYSNGIYTVLNDPAEQYGTFASGINDADQVVGFYSPALGVTYGFLYSGGSYTNVIDPLGTSTFANGINNTSQIVGYYVDGTGDHGFLCSAGTYTTIDDPAAAPGRTFANGINDAGQIVGYYYDSNGVAHGFIDTSGSFVTLDEPSATGGTFAEGINNAGEVVGYYIDATGQHGFLATVSSSPPPNQPPVINTAQSVLTGLLSEQLGLTGSPAVDYANLGGPTTPSGVIAFSDPDTGDRPTATILTENETVKYTDATGTDDTAQLSTTQVSELENAFTIAAEPGNTNTGRIDWIYAIPDNELDFLGAGETITITVPVQIDDGHGNAIVQNIPIAILGQNDNPIAAPDIASVQKGSTLTIGKSEGVLANDTDPDIHDTLTVSAVSAANGSTGIVGQPLKGQYGTLTLNADGAYTYIASASAANGTQDVFTYTVGDGHGGDTVSTLAITIQGYQVIKASPVSQPAQVSLSNNNLVVEMAELAKEAYSESTKDATTRNWIPVNSADLSIPSSATLSGHTYTFFGGVYSAIIPLGFARALVLEGNVNGIKTLAIAFEGTNLPSDPGQVLEWPDFAKYYSNFQPLFESMGKYVAQAGIQQILVTGHSLGGAMVQDFIASVADNKIPGVNSAMVAGYTWGSPGADLHPFPLSNLVNFVDTRDPVPGLGSLGGYVRRGTDILINNPLPPPIDALPTFWHDIANYFTNTYDLVNLAGDHSNTTLYNTADAIALRDGNFSPSSVHNLEVMPGTPQADFVTISPNDQIVLGGSGDDIFSIRSLAPGEAQTNFASIKINGGNGVDTVVVPGIPNFWSWTTAGTDTALSLSGQIVADLTNVEQLRFASTGGTINLHRMPDGPGTGLFAIGT